MSLYKTTLTLRSSDVDAKRRLRLSSLFTLLQEAAIAHTTELGMGREKTLDRGLLWIVTRQQIRVTRLPSYDETVTLFSWPGETLHLYFPRFFRLTDAAGETLLEASTLWALMDQESRHIVFPEEVGVEIEADPEESALPLPAAPRLPELTQEQNFTVPYSYTDLNGHMNNARYPDLAEDLMPPALREKSIREIVTEYGGEASEGETIRLKTAVGEDSFAMAGFGPEEKRLFRLLLRYSGGKGADR